MPQKNKSKTKSALFKVLVWLVAFGCFYLAYRRIANVAANQEQTAWQYLGHFFADVDWLLWLCVMVPYSIFFMLVDSHAGWRIIRWFNAPDIRFMQVLPIRASTYILSLFNEQVSKGGLALYLFKKHEVPLWRGLSSMIYMSMMEVYQLLAFASIGLFLHFDLIQEKATVVPLAEVMTAVILVAAVYFVVHHLYFSGRLLPKYEFLRQQPLLTAFKLSKLKHYGLTLLFKAPTLLGAAVVYTIALQLFNVPVAFEQILTFLPLIFMAAALPLPLHAGALLLWTLLYPEFPEISAFSFVMSVFFIGFNALVGLLFLPKVSGLITSTDADHSLDMPGNQ